MWRLGRAERDENREEWLWLVEGTAGRLQGELAYLNWIDDLLNVDPAQPTFQPAVFLTPRRGGGVRPTLRALGEPRRSVGSGRSSHGCCHRGGQDGSPFTTMAITCANPEVSVTVIWMPVAKAGRDSRSHITNRSYCCAQQKLNWCSLFHNPHIYPSVV